MVIGLLQHVGGVHKIYKLLYTMQRRHDDWQIITGSLLLFFFFAHNFQGDISRDYAV